MLLHDVTGQVEFASMEWDPQSDVQPDCDVNIETW